MKTTMGIDPGTSGAIAIIRGDEIETFPIPYDGNLVDPTAMMSLFLAHKPDKVVIERPQARKGNGTKNTATSFTNFGQLRASALIYGRPVQIVEAADWCIPKRRGTADTKGPRLIKCKELWPLNDWHKDGPVDAALIALYGATGKKQ